MKINTGTIYIRIEFSSDFFLMEKINLEKLKSVLPAVPGIFRKEEYFNSAVLIPLIEINNEYNFLFEKRSAEIRQGGEICFPGGEFDPGKDRTFQETAIRETIEELGIKPDKINIVGALDTFVGPMGITVDSFIALLNVRDLSEFNFDKNEVEKIFLVPLTFFIENEPEKYKMRLELHSYYLNERGEKVDLLPVKQLGLPERYAEPRQGKKHNVYVYKTEKEIIWGITAALIYELIIKIKKIL